MTRASPRIRRDSMHTEERRAIMFVGFHVSVQIGSGITADRHPGVRAASNRAALTEYEQTKQHDGWTMDRYRAEVILSGPEHSPEHKEGRRHRGDTRQANHNGQTPERRHRSMAMTHRTSKREREITQARRATRAHGTQSHCSSINDAPRQWPCNLHGMALLQ